MQSKKLLLQNQLLKENKLELLKSESKLSVSRISADCMQQKGKREKKLISITSQESPSTDSSVLVYLLQEELRNYNFDGTEICFNRQTKKFPKLTTYQDYCFRFCWTIINDMMESQSHVYTPIYISQSDNGRFEFEYVLGNTNILVFCTFMFLFLD